MRQGITCGFGWPQVGNFGGRPCHAWGVVTEYTIPRKSRGTGAALSQQIWKERSMADIRCHQNLCSALLWHLSTCRRRLGDEPRAGESVDKGDARVSDSAPAWQHIDTNKTMHCRRLGDEPGAGGPVDGGDARVR